ncbi:MAG: hypothetical protein JWO05_2032 [Gemmatimonadetes bacterium]|nr:hypothetical protein [Gemmatimonadota bacterium]
MATVRAWLERRDPVPPEALVAHVIQALGGDADLSQQETASHCLAAAERLLESLLDLRRTGRDSALDLLTADALATYAFEHDAAVPAQLDAHASESMRRIAALGARYESAEGVA